MDGIINIYKERGFTSHDVVAKLRGILKQKKIGHTGTLDPDAVGVLPVCLGKGTRLCELLTDKDKTYEAVLKLGVTTDTQDMTGKVLEEKEVVWQEDKIRQTIAAFAGDYDQVPPMYSALKVNGKKLYELAREGREVERKARRVHIFDITIGEMDSERAEIAIKVHCSKGTYIRTLCADIGEKTGFGGCMKSLVRTQVERFLIEDSLTLSEVEELAAKGSLSEKIVSIEEMFSHYREIEISDQADRFLYNGNSFWETNVKRPEAWKEAEILRTYDSKGVFKGLYCYKEEEKAFHPYKMFL